MLGSGGYDDGKRLFRLKAPLTLKVAQAELLRAAGHVGKQADQGRRLRQLKAALTRLTKVAVGGLPPLLRDWYIRQDGKLKLIVSPEWLPREELYAAAVAAT